LTEPRLSVIIPVWNGAALLPDCLAALAAQSAAVHEVIAVDNGSTDGSAALIADRYPHVRLFRNAQNLGFAQACNTGMRAATGDVLVLLNQDTRVEPGWAAALQAAFSRSDAGIIGCKILSAADRSLQHAGGYVHELLGTPFHYGKAAADGGAWDTPREVEYVTGAAMAIHRRVVEQIGGLDERFFPAYYEDVDLCFRARAAGFKVVYWPDAVILHHESTSTPSQTRWFYFQRGRIRFILKHWPLERLLGGFAIAESRFQPAFRADFGNTRPLRLAYLAALMEVPTIVADRWSAGSDELAQISGLLRRLHTQTLSAEFAQLYPGQSLMSPRRADLPSADLDFADVSAPATAPFVPQVVEQTFALPSLTEFEFRSAIPVLGGLVAAIRRAFFMVAAKWALQHVMGQQNAINRVIAERLQQLERKIADLAVWQEAATRHFAVQQEVVARQLMARQDALAHQFMARQDALAHHLDDYIGKLQDYLAEREAHATAVNRFLLDNIAQTEEETIFALLWPLRWDIVLDSTTSQKEAK